jgi:uncharacterized protein YhaN
MFTSKSKTQESNPFKLILEELPDAKVVRNQGRKDGRPWRRAWLSISSPAFRTEKTPVPPADQEDTPTFEAELQATANRLRRMIDERAEQRKEALRTERDRIQVNGDAAEDRFKKAKDAEQRREEKRKAVQERLDGAPRPTISRTAMFAVESVTALGEGALASVALYGLDVPLIAAGCGGLISGAGVACGAHELGKQSNKTNRSGLENLTLVGLTLLLSIYVYFVSHARWWYMEAALGLESAGFALWLFVAVSAILIAAAFLASYAGHTENLEFQQLSQKKTELEEELADLHAERQEAEEELVELGSKLRQVENALERLPDRVEAAKETVSETIGERIDAYRTANVRARPDQELPRCWRSANGASTHVH